MDEKPTYIYVLCEPDGETVRYVGKTIDLSERFHQHTNAYWLRRERTHKANWVRSLLERGEKPVMIVIEEVPPGGDWVEAEKRWIAHYREVGCNLTNLTDGGDGQSPGFVPSEETRRKMSEAQRGRRHSDETKAKISAAHKGHSRGRGRPHSPEHNAKVSAALKGRPSPQAGKPLSEETKRKISEAQRGKPRGSKGRRMTEEQRAAHSGWHHSDEAKQRMSEQKREWWRQRKERERLAKEQAS